MKEQQQPTESPPPFRRKGILALLPPTAHYFPHDPQKQWKTPTKRYSNKPSKAIQAATSWNVQPNSVVVLLQIDPRQPHSRVLVQKLAEVLLLQQQQQATKSNNVNNRYMHGLILDGSNQPTATHELLTGSGLHWLTVPPNNNGNNQLWRMAAGLDTIPSLVVLETNCGSKISALAYEELGLYWNDPQTVDTAWRLNQQSCLSMRQSIQAHVLYPSCTIQ